ncbi:MULTISPECIES: CPBP family intramembrane glutamic endopeptidase [unclassified Salinibacterium]|uniref:CPBP family intramembrane glutamic endopeptidase n=1 Tax=unclassified Salinibacterium TaxID=2632331 RepID=UPI00143CC6FF|nr:MULTISPECIES: type II CAAX endopeptidase family protein [unclassified Salinibacterium]
MLSPDDPLARIVLAAALVALLALLVVRAARKDRREYSRFKRYRTTRRRQAMMRKWLIESFLVHGGAAAVVLLLAWQQVPLMLAAIEDLAAVQWLRDATSEGLLKGFLIGAVGALLVASIALLPLARGQDEVVTVGDIHALLPRNRGELRYGALLSINAGVVEELLFRLALPAAIFGVTGSVAAAVLGSTAIFAALHLYQGASGVIGSAIIGALLMAVFVGTGSILVAIAVHAFIDLRSLVAIPMIVYRVHRKA